MLLSLLKMLIIVVLLITLANIKQLIYKKILYLKIVGIYKKHCLKFQSTQGSFFSLLFRFAIYGMVDSEYNMDIYISVKISIETVIRNPEMLKFAPDHLKTKKCVNIKKWLIKCVKKQF